MTSALDTEKPHHEAICFPRRSNLTISLTALVRHLLLEQSSDPHEQQHLQPRSFRKSFPPLPSLQLGLGLLLTQMDILNISKEVLPS